MALKNGESSSLPRPDSI